MIDWSAVTDRHAAYIVVLEENIREDDAQATLSALGMVRGVASVKPVVASAEVHVAQERALHRLRSEVAAVLWPQRNAGGVSA